MTQEYRVGNHQPRNIYRGQEYIGVMFSPRDAALVVISLNLGAGVANLAAETEDDVEPCAQLSVHTRPHRWHDARGVWHTCPGVPLPASSSYESLKEASASSWAPPVVIEGASVPVCNFSTYPSAGIAPPKCGQAASYRYRGPGLPEGRWEYRCATHERWLDHETDTVVIEALDGGDGATAPYPTGGDS
jgi:hypothetical protein